MWDFECSSSCVRSSKQKNESVKKYMNSVACVTNFQWPSVKPNKCYIRHWYRRNTKTKKVKVVTGSFVQLNTVHLVFSKQVLCVKKKNWETLSFIRCFAMWTVCVRVNRVYIFKLNAMIEYRIRNKHKPELQKQNQIYDNKKVRE